MEKQFGASFWPKLLAGMWIGLGAAHDDDHDDDQADGDHDEANDGGCGGVGDCDDGNRL